MEIYQNFNIYPQLQLFNLLQKIYYIIARMNTKTSITNKNQPNQDSDDSSFCSEQSQQYQQLDNPILKSVRTCNSPKKEVQHSLQPQIEISNNLQQKNQRYFPSIGNQKQIKIIQNESLTLDQLKKQNDGLRFDIKEQKNIIEHIQLTNQELKIQNKQMRSQLLSNQSTIQTLQLQLNTQKQIIQEISKEYTVISEEDKLIKEKLRFMTNRLLGKPLETYNSQNIDEYINVEFSYILKLSRIIHQLNSTLSEKYRQKQAKISSASNTKIDFQEILKKVEKIQMGVYRLQSQTTAHRQYIYKLQKQNQSLKQSQVGPMKKWLDPVLKFCKIQEQTPIPPEKKQLKIRKIKAKDEDIFL